MNCSPHVGKPVTLEKVIPYQADINFTKTADQISEPKTDNDNVHLHLHISII